MFFFWSEEWQEQLVPNTAHNVTVPTALERKGDFSQSVSSANHQPVKIYDPTQRSALSRERHSGQPDLGARPGIAEPLSPAQPVARREFQPSWGRHLQLPDPVAGFVSPPRGFAAAGLQPDRKDPRLWPLHQRHIERRNSLRHLGIGDQPADRADLRADSGQQPGGGNDLHDHARR